MRKKVLFIFILILFLLSSNVYAESVNSIYWNKSVVHLDMHNNTLFSQIKSENVARRQYESALADAQTIDPNGISVSFMGKEKYFRFDSYTQMLLTQQKEFVPEQMRFSWEMARDNRAITRNAMVIGLRGLYFGLYSADSNCRLEKMKFELAEEIYRQEQIKFERGLISELELAQADYNFTKAKKSYEASVRNVENMLRNYNSYIGLDIDTDYDEILFNEKYNDTRLKQQDYYVNRALDSRLDITSAKKQLSLMEKRKDIIDRYPSSLGMMHVRQEYDLLITDIESQKLQLEATKMKVEKEIKSAYVDVTTAEKNVTRLGKMLELQNNNFENVTEYYRKGLVSKNTLDQTRINYIELENNYKAVLFDYNTRLMKLEYASDIGPAYEGV